MDQSPEQHERARSRDERERDLMGHLALIAPTPELLRKVVALQIEVEDRPSARPATETDQLIATRPDR